MSTIEFAPHLPDISEEEQKRLLKTEKRINFNYMPLPLDFVDSGFLRIINPSAYKLFTCLLRHADFTTGLGYIYHEQIVSESGIYKKRIAENIKRLTNLFLIKIISVNKRKHYIRYKISYYQTTNTDTNRKQRLKQYPQKGDNRSILISSKEG